jgi:hypothetical protein
MRISLTPNNVFGFLHELKNLMDYYILIAIAARAIIVLPLLNK